MATAAILDFVEVNFDGEFACRKFHARISHTGRVISIKTKFQNGAHIHLGFSQKKNLEVGPKFARFRDVVFNPCDKNFVQICVIMTKLLPLK